MALRFFLFFIFIFLVSSVKSQDRNSEEFDIKDLEFIFQGNSMTKPTLDSISYFGYGFAVQKAYFAEDMFNFYYGLRFNTSQVLKPIIHTKSYDDYINMDYHITSFAATPFMFRLNVGNKFRFFAEIGFSLEYYYKIQQQGSIIDREIVNHDLIVNDTLDVSGYLSDYRAFDLGLNYGGGFIIVTKRVGYKIGAGYHVGAFNILDFDKNYIDGLHNNYWNVNVGLFFRKYKPKKKAKF
jgi:hypothetical protein